MALIWIALGVIVGWNLPQPAWAAAAQAATVAWVKKQFASHTDDSGTPTA